LLSVLSSIKNSLIFETLLAQFLCVVEHIDTVDSIRDNLVNNLIKIRPIMIQIQTAF